MRTRAQGLVPQGPPACTILGEQLLRSSGPPVGRRLRAPGQLSHQLSAPGKQHSGEDEFADGKSLSQTHCQFHGRLRTHVHNNCKNLSFQNVKIRLSTVLAQFCARRTPPGRRVGDFC